MKKVFLSMLLLSSLSLVGDEGVSRSDKYVWEEMDAYTEGKRVGIEQHKSPITRDVKNPYQDEDAKKSLFWGLGYICAYEKSAKCEEIEEAIMRCLQDLAAREEAQVTEQVQQ